MLACYYFGEVTENDKNIKAINCVTKEERRGGGDYIPKKLLFFSHVSFTVATSVLEDKLGSYGSSFIADPTSTSQLMSVSIPLSPKSLTYTVACDSATSTLCKMVRTVNATIAQSSLGNPLQELAMTSNIMNLSVS